MKNILSNLILVFVAMVCMSTTGCWGSKEYEPCDDGPKCEPKALGVLKLEQNSASAIPYQGNETVTFVNPQGFQAVFKGQGIQTDTDEQFVVTTDPCPLCNEYYLKQRRTLSLTGQNLNFDIAYKIIKNTPEDSYSTIGTDTALVKDVLVVSLGETRFALSLATSAVNIQAFKQTKFYDSLAIGNQVYRQVYEIYEPYLDNSTIRPKGIYYTRQQGLVGYYFTNNELWYKL